MKSAAREIFAENTLDKTKMKRAGVVDPIRTIPTMPRALIPPNLEPGESKL